MRLSVHSIRYALLLLVALLTACSLGKATQEPLPEGAYPVDALFRPLYERLGGEAVLGAAITPLFEHQEVFYQYTVNGLMMFDRLADEGDRFRLAPLGRDLGIYELPSTHTQPGAVVVNGYRIFDAFVPLYRQMGGDAVVGKPLTEAHKNNEKNRYEQYFENAGFYWIEGDEPDAVRLLAYGAWKCDRSCRHAPPQSALVQQPAQFAEPFVRKVAELRLDFTGFALTPPYLTAGKVYQVYENVVLVASPQQPVVVNLLDLPAQVGIKHDPLAPPVNNPNLFFYPVQGELGYNVPIYFMDYIRAHGGLEVVGPPITQLLQVEGEIYRQCFMNVCLERIPGAQVEISPVRLGEKYRDLFYGQGQSQPAGGFGNDVIVQIWEAYPMVSPGQDQEIGVAVHTGNIPLPGVQPELELAKAGGAPEKLPMPLTDVDGESKIVISTRGAENGTLIPYKVCVTLPSSQRFCVMDSYLVWKTDLVSTSPAIPVNNQAFLPFVLHNIDVYIPAVINAYTMYLPLLNGGN